jgi:transglutaminase-like putative cysteine protease
MSPAMVLSVGCSLHYQVLAPTAAFAFNVLATENEQQRILSERYTCQPAPLAPPEPAVTGKGDRLLRLEAAQGPFLFHYEATVEVHRPPLPDLVPIEPPARLPAETLAYTLPSRYSQSDLLIQQAWDLFGQLPNRVEQVRAICRWVDQNLTYAPGATDARTSAWDVWQSRRGVCRDYTHLAIALCRALSIPARYAGGYAAGLTPMDFHACLEVWLAGDWRLLDPSDDIPADRIALCARGRDAASAGLTTIFGKVQAGAVKVTCAPAGATAAA